MSPAVRWRVVVRRIYWSIAVSVTAACCMAGVVWSRAVVQPAPEALAAIPPWEELVGEVPADSENAAVLYERAFERIAMSWEQIRAVKLCLQSERPPDAQLAELEALVAENAEVFALVHEAGKRPRCVYPLEPRDPFIRPRFVADVLEVVILEVARALVLADSGDVAGACTALADALDCSRNPLRGLPASATFFCEARGINLTCACLRTILPDAQVDAADTEPLEASLRRIDLRADLVTALRGEGAWTLALFDTVCGSDTAPSAGVRAQGPDLAEHPVICLRLSRKAFVEDIADTIERASEPGVVTQTVPLHDVPDSDAPLQWAEVPEATTRSLLVARDTATAWQRMSLIALEIAHDGHAPRSLDSLRPALGEDCIEDAFSGSTFRYARTGDGFVLYSLGRDLDDDGGVPQHPMGTGFEGDLVWRTG